MSAVHLRTTQSGLYLTAEHGGGDAVRANRVAAGPWETFALLDLDGSPLRSGDAIQLRTADGQHLVRAQEGGGHGVDAASTNPGPWETWRIVRTGGDGEIAPGDWVALAASNGQFMVAEGGGGDVVNANRASAGPWETFQILTDAPAAAADVLPSDTVLVRPEVTGPVLATITGYEMNAPCPFAEAHCERPLYATYDRDTDAFWDVLVEELAHSRVHVVLAHGRGCYDPNQGTAGNGNMCPRLLSRLVAAIDRAGLRDVMRLGMWDDTGAYQGTRNAVDGLPDGTRFDLADTTSWRFFWDHNMRIWFDTVPPDLWYRLDGHPIVAFWSLSDYFFQNQKGNARALLADLRAKFQARYGEDPLFDVDVSWIQTDPTITATEAQGVNDWFGPPANHFTVHHWNGAGWGAGVPGFRDPDNAPGCGAACREVPRDDGAALRGTLSAAQGTKLMLLEGWTDVAESAGYYRSGSWSFPNQYIGILREYADPATPTLRFEAEAADAYFDTTPGNAGGAYRGGDLDIAPLPGSGWFVGWTDPGEWIEYRDVALACGTYRFTARLAPHAASRVHLEIDGQPLDAVDLDGAAGFLDAHLGTRAVAAGRHTLRFVFDTGGVDLDWFFSRKALSACP